MWEQIRANRTRSIVLVTVMAVMLLLIGYFLGFYIFNSGLAGLFIALVIWFILTLVAFYSGDSILLSLAKAKKIGPDDYPRLYNVVEEMKIASGLEKMPGVYIIDDRAMNAFATGSDPNKASVAITTGLLEKLNRDAHGGGKVGVGPGDTIVAVQPPASLVQQSSGSVQLATVDLQLFEVI